MEKSVYSQRMNLMLNNTSITLKQICFNIDSLFLLSGSLDKNNANLNKDCFLNWASINLTFIKTVKINNPDIKLSSQDKYSQTGNKHTR